MPPEEMDRIKRRMDLKQKQKITFFVLFAIVFLFFAVPIYMIGQDFLETLRGLY